MPLSEFHILRLMDADKGYEINVGEWLWVVVKASAYPLDNIVRYSAVTKRLLHPDDYVIWCESPLGNTKLASKQGLLTVNAHMLQERYLPCNT